MILELNASDDRGIDVVRDRIKEFAGTKNMFSNQVKLIVLDEADAMTSEAQAALRRVIEKYTTNTRFCMICNYVNKIIPALQSRCTKFRFSPLKTEQIVGRLEQIIQAEHVNATESGRTAILSLAGGDMRRVLNLLQTTHMAYKIVDEQSVFLTAGAAVPAVIDHFLKSLLHDTFEVSFKTIMDGIVSYGYALSDIITEITIRVTALELPNEVMSLLMDKMSDVEYRLSHGASERIQLGSLVAAFTIGRQMMTA
jgi:replication factor C subunit 3/5